MPWTLDCTSCGRANAGLESNFTVGTPETEEFIRFNRLLAGLSATLRGRNIKFALQIECYE